MQMTHPIARYRKENGLTQAALAEKLEVQPITISRWERGQLVPRRSLWPRIKDVTGISADELTRAVQ